MNFQAWFCSALEAGGEDGIFIKDSDSRWPVNIPSVKKKKKYKKSQKKTQPLLQADTEKRLQDDTLQGMLPPRSCGNQCPRGAECPGSAGSGRAEVGATLGSNGPAAAPGPRVLLADVVARDSQQRQDMLLPLWLRGTSPGPLTRSVTKRCAVTQTTGQGEY